MLFIFSYLVFLKNEIFSGNKTNKPLFQFCNITFSRFAKVILITKDHKHVGEHVRHDDGIPENIKKRVQESKKYVLDICVDCKGVKLLCGAPRCPILQTLSLEVKPKINKPKKIIFGPAPQVFLGSRTYPWINTGGVVLPEETEIKAEAFSDPKKWLSLPLPSLLDIRFSSIRGEKAMPAKKTKGGSFLENLQELAKSIKPIDIELELDKTPKISENIDVIVSPLGPAAPARKARLVDNPIIPRKVDNVLEEDTFSRIHLKELYEKGFDVYYLQQIFSIGLTGKKKQRRLVPTRWSITAVDNNLGQILLDRIRLLPENSEYLLFENVLLDNHYFIVVFPGKWAFEHFEAWLPGSIFTLNRGNWIITRDGEGFSSAEQKKVKWRYSNQAGGYYAARLGVMEYLVNKLKKQATVLAIREIGPYYIVPVGVVQVRENVRAALEKKPIKFNSKHEVIEYLRKKTMVGFKEYLLRSRILGQQKLTDYF